MDGVVDDGELAARLAVGRVRLLRRVERRQRAQRAGVLGAAALVVGLGLAAGVGGAAPGAVAAHVSCYSAVDLAAAHSTVRLPGGVSADALSAAQLQRLCDRVWSTGAAAVGSSDDTDARVIACRSADGTVAVFRAEYGAGGAEKVCDRLGLSALA